jgi:hypothetical protein
MAKLVIEGRSFEIAPYKIGALRRAAPHIDAINASVQALQADVAGDVTSIVGLLENTEHIIAILSIGLEKIDPALTSEVLEEMLGPDDMAALGVALRDILAESGLAPKGEVTAPAGTTETAGA